MFRHKKHFKKHFRINRSKQSHNHPAYVIRKKGDYYDYIGLTHSPLTDGRRNIKLRKNPNPKENRASYIRPFFRKDPIKKFSKRRVRGWKISKRDKKKIRKYSRIRE